MNNFQNTETPILPLLMQRHIAEINALWCRRRLTMTSTEHMLLDLEKIDFRIRAHTEALLAGSLHSHALLLQQEQENDRDAEFAVSYALLETGDDLVRKTLCQRLATVQHPILQGLRDAWVHSNLGGSDRYVRQILHTGNAENAVYSAEILAMHGLLIPTDVVPMNRLMRDANAWVRACAWRIPRYLNQTDSVTESLLCEQNVRFGIEDEDPQVRRAVGWTTAWCANFKAEYNFIDTLKHDVELLSLLVALADYTHRDDIEVALNRVNSVDRSQLIGAYGNSSFIPMLLDDMSSSNVPRCYSAGLAYTRITGVDITSDQRALLHPDPDSVDEFDKEFLQTVSLPDPDLANAHWQKHKQRFKLDSRWHRGHDITHDQSSEALAAMDMDARWSLLTRQRIKNNCKFEMSQIIRIRHSAPSVN